MDINSLFDVKGKIVLVTGGAKGIGRMISEGFAANGAKVYISSRDAKACEKAAAELNAKGRAISIPDTSIPDGLDPGMSYMYTPESQRPSVAEMRRIFRIDDNRFSYSYTGNSTGKGGSAVALPADLQSVDECKRLATELEKREGKLHVLVNNSGAAWGEDFDTFPDHAWTKLLTLNLQRVFTLTQLLTPLLERAAVKGTDPARLIHIGSIDALRVPILSNFAYSASKAGLHHLSRTLAANLGPRGITSNTLACGPFPSKMMAAVLETFGDELRGNSPVGRIGTPEDAAGACLFLASRAGAFVNGATIRLDGGISQLAKI